LFPLKKSSHGGNTKISRLTTKYGEKEKLQPRRLFRGGKSRGFLFFFQGVEEGVA